MLKTILSLAVIFCPVLAESNSVVRKVSDLQCLTANLYFEARGEQVKGKQAVADVTLNRVLSKHYPKSVCSVVFQRKQFSWTFQQSWKSIDNILMGKLHNLKKADILAYERAKQVAVTTLGGYKILPVNTLHYHAVYVKPSWASKMKKYATIGSHVFYRS